MRNLVRCGVLICTLLVSCDVYKQDPSIITPTAKVSFQAQQSTVVSLNAALNLSNVGKYEIVDGPSSGKVEILLNKFLVYTPGNLKTENATLRLLDNTGNEIGNGKIAFEENPSACGIVPFTHAEIAGDSVLHIHLADQSLVCTQMTSGAVSGVDVENSDGFTISLDLASGSLDLIYDPKGFVGTAKVIYMAGINIKPGFSLSSINNAEDLIKASHEFEYFITSIAEVKVDAK